MDLLTVKYVLWAVALGTLSAVSLPLGSLVGLRMKLQLPAPLIHLQKEVLSYSLYDIVQVDLFLL